MHTASAAYLARTDEQRFEELCQEAQDDADEEAALRSRDDAEFDMDRAEARMAYPGY